MSAPALPRVAVLMGTCNGAAFLPAQLASLFDQEGVDVHVWASDDGSTDATRDLLIAAGEDRVTVMRGPCRGFAANFGQLLAHPGIEGDYFAFSDQDDVWEPHKLRAAIDWLKEQDPEQPALFCSRTALIDATSNPLGLSPLFSRPPSFGNALVQSIAGGNTMAWNGAAQRLLARASREVSFVSHDWWAYMMVTGAGGTVHYSREPLVRYRQHGSNVIGSNAGWAARRKRLLRLLQGQLAQWTDQNLQALETNAHLLTPQARETLRQMVKSRRAFLAVKRFRSLRRSGAYRQTLLGNAGLYMASAIRRL